MRDVRLARVAFDIEVVKEQLEYEGDQGKRRLLIAEMKVLLDKADRIVKASPPATID